ncbi:hypothetical protein NE237_032142 [Protea cynaroides]|uniref:Uncharacterized protein n=1 Tax=Protea cynaroides TaxID=273540 RepID=A0A9Q0L2V2_9MAGN|nr:hypothetical protein NE237_032142 [Protea cynaroides]
MAWNIMIENSIFAKFMTSRYLQNGYLKRVQDTSYVIKRGLKVLWDWTGRYVRWLVGNGNNINFWTDYWLGSYSAVEYLDLRPSETRNLKEKVYHYIRSGNWEFPQVKCSRMQNLIDQALDIPITKGMEDKPIWTLTTTRKFSVASTYKGMQVNIQKPSWVVDVWNKALMPRNSFLDEGGI